MLENLTLLFPAFVCLFWVVTMFCDRKYASRPQYICMAVFGVLAAAFLFWDYFIGYTLLARYPVTVSCLMVVMSFLLYAVGYRVSQAAYPAESPERAQSASLSTGEDDLASDSAEEEEDPQQNKHLKLLPEFNRLMDQEMLYLQPGLKIEDIANRLNTNRTYVSRLLSEEYNSGFFDYVNYRRITYAQARMRIQPTLTQERLAAECGFTHASTFSRVFKQYTGVTFRQWQKIIHSGLEEKEEENGEE